MLKLYGIPNCDQVKKAKDWLDKNNLAYEFFDFKNDALKEDTLTEWMRHEKADQLVNKRSTSWRQLNDLQKLSLANLMTQQSKAAIKLLIENPTLLKRPILVNQESIEFGFDESQYAKLLK